VKEPPWYADSCFRSCMTAAAIWARHSDPFARWAARYWLNQAIGWASR